MYFYGDYHMHTLASDGRGTLEEMIQAGRSKGLREISVTEHGPANLLVGIESPEVLLGILKYARLLNKVFDGEFRVLVGVEANVTSCEGDIDIPYEIYKQLDQLLVGLHPNIIPETLRSGISLVGGNKLAGLFHGVRDAVTDINTRALVAALRRHPVKVVTHPGLGMPVDIGEISAACRDTGAAFEINTGHNYQTVGQVREALVHGAQIIVNSDAHFPETVGELQVGWELLIAARASPEQVVNLAPQGRKRLAELKEHGGLSENKSH
jgi:putative hydrolase